MDITIIDYLYWSYNALAVIACVWASITILKGDK